MANARNRHWSFYLVLALALVEIIVGIGNGLFMLIAPNRWYFTVPGVVDSGFYNQHFIRDIGMIYILIGAAFAIGLARPSRRVELWGAATSWLVAHAMFHFWQVSVGICAPSALARDFPGVTTPGLVGIILTIWAWRTGASERATAAA